MTANLQENRCPGCNLWMPAGETATNTGYYNASAECWSPYTEVLGEEYRNAFLAGRVRQLTVDAYAVQHAGGQPDKSVDVHLCGLYPVLEKGFRSSHVPPNLQRLSAAIEFWPHFPPPEERGVLTIFDVAICGPVLGRIHTTREWARSVWESWSPHHAAVARLVSDHLDAGLIEVNRGK